MVDRECLEVSRADLHKKSWKGRKGGGDNEIFSLQKSIWSLKINLSRLLPL